jgi:hypothetical protein
MAGRQASATYDDAIRRNFSTDQAEDLALKAGSIGFLTTVIFSAAGAGGVEGIASGAARQALRESLRGTARNALRESLMAGGKGLLGEMAEEQIITALDAALVQAELRPGMTAEDFQRAVYETAVVTFISSGGGWGSGRRAPAGGDAGKGEGRRRLHGRAGLRRLNHGDGGRRAQDGEPHPRRRVHPHRLP